MSLMRLFLFTTLAMIAFASNSLLCRAALKETGIDAATFTFVRIFSGAVALWLILQIRKKMIVDQTASPLVESSLNSSLVTRHMSLASGNWPSALALFVYAAAFSFAYNTLAAGTGALLLFGAVQATMILWGFRKGERLRVIQIAGLGVAIGGLVVLVFPGLSAPPLIGSMLMLSAGIAWGIYSLRGKTAGDAIAATAGNFLRAVPFAALVSVILWPKMQLDSLGLTYAVISGAITSGLGYVIWYAALAGLKSASAATVQLSVPVLAATGGILLLGEPITLRYMIASVAVLGGIFLVVIEKRIGPSSPQDESVRLADRTGDY
ncbi:MAG: EamA family transporter [Verrucomicrobia bacterium]|nr:MAG: EamA family transporter [Verrucomicrobiota bacterium]